MNSSAVVVGRRSSCSRSLPLSETHLAKRKARLLFVLPSANCRPACCRLCWSCTFRGSGALGLHLLESPKCLLSKDLAQHCKALQGTGSGLKVFRVTVPSLLPPTLLLPFGRWAEGAVRSSAFSPKLPKVALQLPPIDNLEGCPCFQAVDVGRPRQFPAVPRST